MKRLSVIVAAYNAEAYIDRCISSILSQNADVEIVVVNDGSTDKTSDILARYSEIKLVELEKNSKNIARVRNIGLENASGEFITYCDADDFYMPDALNKILELQQKTDADIVRFSHMLVFEDGSRKRPFDGTFEDEFVEKSGFVEKVYPYFIDGIGLNSVCLAVFRRKVVENIRFDEYFQTAEDAAFSIEAYTNANSVLFCSEPFYCYYRHGNSLTGSGLSIYKKYKYNFAFAKKTLRFLPQWGMNTLAWRIRAMLRPLKITIDKIRR